MALYSTVLVCVREWGLAGSWSEGAESKFQYVSWNGLRTTNHCSRAWPGVQPKIVLFTANGLYFGDKTRNDYLINFCLNQLILQFVVEREKSAHLSPIQLVFVQPAFLCQKKTK